MIEILLSFSLASFFLACSPGPDNIFVLTQSIANGSSYGIATTTGLVAGCIVHTTLVAFGISTLLTASEHAFWALKILGALYMLYLAYKVFKAGNTINLEHQPSSKKTHLQLFKQGVIMNLLNPKVSLFFLAFFPGFLWDRENDVVFQFYVLGFLFMAISFVVFSAIALFSGWFSNTLRHKKQTGSFVKWTQILVFTGISIFLILT